MSGESLPTVDAIKIIAAKGREDQRAKDARDFKRQKESLEGEIYNAIRNQQYKLGYELTGEDVSQTVKQQLCDWVNEQPGYRARWECYCHAFDELVIKIPREHPKGPRRWPFWISWIPGLRGR